MKRLTLRGIARDHEGKILQVIEQSIPATTHEVGLALRRDPFKRLVAEALLIGGNATLEVKP